MVIKVKILSILISFLCGVFAGSLLISVFGADVADFKAKGDDYVYRVDSALEKRDEIDGKNVAVRGYVYCDSADVCWLMDAVADSNARINLPRGWLFDLKAGSWSREVIIVGRYGTLDKSFGYDMMMPVESVRVSGAVEPD